MITLGMKHIGDSVQKNSLRAQIGRPLHCI